MEVWGFIQQLVRNLMERIAALLQNTPPGTIQITGILGLAAVVVGYYQLRGGNRRPNSSSTTRSTGFQPTTRNEGSNPSTSARSQQNLQDGLKPFVQESKQSEPLSKIALAVRSQLSGARKVSISSLGVLLAQQSPDDLLDGAIMHSGISALLLEIAKATDLYIITHVSDDVGEVVVMGALEASGIVGLEPGKVKPHKMLFCSSLDGKVSIVRQIEPDLHIDASLHTIEQLQRFMPQLLHITPQAAVLDSPNVGSVPSLQQYFNV